MPLKVGVIGCGNISGIYLKNAKTLRDIEIVACADLVLERARAQADAYGVPTACTVDELLGNPGIDIVLNLTIPAVHAEVALAALRAAKHVYGEKPLAVTPSQGEAILALAREKGLRVGCAPDTFLGGAIQTCVELIDSGAIGEPVAATAFMLCRGHETWHPDPAFYYQPGGGPLFDMGPYYLTALVALLGPIRRVGACARASFPERTITSKPRTGEVITVKTPTHIAGNFDFVSGAIGTIITSFDVCAHTLPCIQIYGSTGTLTVPDPNCFGEGQTIQLWRADSPQWVSAPFTHGHLENSRGVGLADMAAAIIANRPHRASGALGMHVLETMQGFLDSAIDGTFREIQTPCERPRPFPRGLANGMVD